MTEARDQMLWNWRKIWEVASLLAFTLSVVLWLTAGFKFWTGRPNFLWWAVGGAAVWAVFVKIVQFWEVNLRLEDEDDGL